MVADYHHTVIDFATPSEEFTKWWWIAENSSMTIDEPEIRRANLKRLIAKRFHGNLSALARIYSPDDPRPSYFSDLLRTGTKKSFGEKAARRIEEAVGLQRGQLDVADSPLLRDPKSSNRIAYEIHAAVEDLSEEEQAELYGALQRLRRRRPRPKNAS